MSFAGANNSLLLLRKENEIVEIKADRKSIGGVTEVDYEFTTKETSVNCLIFPPLFPNRPIIDTFFSRANFNALMILIEFPQTNIAYKSQYHLYQVPIYLFLRTLTVS